MKLKCLKNGILQKEEDIGHRWISSVCYKNCVNITNIDLAEFTETDERLIEIETDRFLKITVNHAPFLQEVYDIMDNYKGIYLVEFQLGEIQILVEW